MFGNLLEDEDDNEDKEGDDNTPRSENGRTLLQIVKDDMNKTTGHSTIAMVAVSGAGKTASVISLAMKHDIFVIYFLCTLGNTAKPYEITDTNFQRLVGDIITFSIKCQTYKSEVDLIGNDDKMRSFTEYRVNIEFLA